jgi:hypothetical protein
MLLSEGQMSDFGGAALMIDAFTKTKARLGDKGYKADWFRDGLATRKIEACILSKSNRKIRIRHDTVLYRQRHKSRSCSEGSKTVGAFTLVTAGAPTTSYPPSASPQLSSSVSINES